MNQNPNHALANPYESLPLLKKGAMAALKLLYKFLPRSWYERIYHPAFASYQKMLRAEYWLRWKLGSRANDSQNLKMKQRVHAVMPYSLVGAVGLEHTHQRAREVLAKSVSGAFVECGVARGGCAAILAMVAAEDDRRCWFFDSFAGLPDPTDEDFQEGKTGDHVRPLPRGSCYGGIEQVSQLLFEQFGINRNMVRLVKGWFQDTCSQAAEGVGTIAFLRIDGDWYDSTKLCLEIFYDQVALGGCLLIDDYFSCYGARKATDEFIHQRELEVRLVSDGRGGCSFHKPDESRENGSSTSLLKSVAYPLSCTDPLELHGHGC